MIIRYLFILFCGMSLTSIAQTAVYQESNNVRAYLSGVGTFFFNDSSQLPHYEVPIGSGINAIYSTQFWFAGQDITGQLKMAAGGSPGEGTDVFNGPLSAPGTYSSTEYQNQWGRHVWTICQSDIDNYDRYWRCQNIAGTPGCDTIQPVSPQLMEIIQSWPGNGNVTMGQSAQLAPFFDRDGDGTYDPSNGDLPQIKGCCATYLIQNDMAGLHTYSNAEPTKVEMHYLFYQYANWDYLNDVTFVDIKAINKSGVTYPEFAISMVVDADLGFFGDDFMGTDSLSSTLFFYNGDNNDESSASGLGYGIDPPAIGIVALNESATSAIPFNNPVFSPVERWNLMKGLQANGAPFTNPNGQATSFYFSGNPNNPGDWSEWTSGGIPGERRAMLSTLFSNFQHNDTMNQTFAISYARSGDHLANVQAVLDISDDMHLFFENDSIAPCENGILAMEELNEVEIEIYPNPTSGTLHLVSPSRPIHAIKVYNGTGQLIRFETVDSDYVELNLTGENAGLYLVEIQTDLGATVKKIRVE